MSTVRLAVVGIGNLRTGVAVIASLASYFGERDLEVLFWDADEERLDLYERLARACFTTEKSKHLLASTGDLREALDGVNRALLTLSENCARKLLRQDPTVSEAAMTREQALTTGVEEVILGLDPAAKVLSLIHSSEAVAAARRRTPARAEPQTTYLSWPEPLNDEQRRAIPHQILRWLRGDEYLTGLIDQFRNSPIKRWLDNPNAEL